MLLEKNGRKEPHRSISTGIYFKNEIQSTSTMKKGDMVKFDFDDFWAAYGIIISLEGESATVNYRNPETGEYDVKTKNLSELTKIGHP